MNEEQAIRAAAINAAIEYATMKYSTYIAMGEKIPAGFVEDGDTGNPTELPLGSFEWILDNAKAFAGYIKTGRI